LKDNREIEQIFSDKLNGYEADVNPELWSNIASQIGAAATPLAGGISLLSKITIAAVASVVIGSVVYISTTDKEKSPENITAERVIKEKEVKKIQTENISEQTTDFAIEESKTEENRVVDASPVDLTPLDENPPLVDVIPQPIVSIETNQDVYIPTLQEVTEEPESINKPTPKQEYIEDIEIIEEYKISKMPDIFSPNNDGANDFFFVKNEGLSDFNIVIMNNRNETVYQSQDPDFNWDGMGLNGEQTPIGNTFILLSPRIETIKRLINTVY